MSEMKIRIIQNRVDDILKYLKPFKALANCHMVDYVTDNHFEKLIPQGVASEIRLHGGEEAVRAFWTIRDEMSHTDVRRNRTDTDSSSQNNIGIKKKFKNLYSFILEADRHCIKPDRELCYSVEDFEKKLKNLGTNTKDSLKITECMSEKKSHEVEALSSMLATLSSLTGATHTIDLGGGKGFLSGTLTMLFRMKVLNIDCSPANALGAEDRNAKMQKLWPGLQHKAEQLKLGKIVEKKGRAHRNKKINNNPENPSNSEELDQLVDVVFKPRPCFKPLRRLKNQDNIESDIVDSENNAKNSTDLIETDQNDNFKEIPTGDLNQAKIETPDNNAQNLTNCIVDSKNYVKNSILSIDSSQIELLENSKSDVHQNKIDDPMITSKSENVAHDNSMDDVQKSLEEFKKLNVGSTSNDQHSHKSKEFNVDCVKSDIISSYLQDLKKLKNSIIDAQNYGKSTSIREKSAGEHLEDKKKLIDAMKQKSSPLPAVPVLPMMNNTAKKKTTCQNPLYRHVTKFITERTDLVGLITENFHDSQEDGSIRLCLTGLHTCGNLGSSSLRLFQRCPSASVLCAVPCCYHLITEQTDYQALSQEPIDGRPGFPMSIYLRGINIGRNARMLASQSVDRVCANRELPSMSLYYRALLQVVLRRIHGFKIPEGRMKKIGVKCSDFNDYIKKAMIILQFDVNMAQIHNWDEFLDQYQPQSDNFMIFYLLRMCLAPVIESLILLDRLMFLAENGFANQLGDCFIVKMFDPVISPRCHSLVAYRKKRIMFNNTRISSAITDLLKSILKDSSIHLKSIF